MIFIVIIGQWQLMADCTSPGRQLLSLSDAR